MPLLRLLSCLCLSSVVWLGGCASWMPFTEGSPDSGDLSTPNTHASAAGSSQADAAEAAEAAAQAVEGGASKAYARPPSPPVIGDQVPTFSSARPGVSKLPGWEPWVIHPAKKRTRYRLESEGGRTVLRARASSSASGLLARLDADPERTPVMRWSWKAHAVPADADTADAAREDSPLRVVVAFDGDKQSLPVADRMFFERVKLFTGRDMPYATLMYVWEHGKPVETVVRNPHTGRVRKIVVSSGPDGVRRWQKFQRNLVEDYQRVFGSRPGRVVAVAVMTDSDNTRQDVDAVYGDISLSPN